MDIIRMRTEEDHELQRQQTKQRFQSVLDVMRPADERRYRYMNRNGFVGSWTEYVVGNIGERRFNSATLFGDPDGVYCDHFDRV
jgi:hypothetical protein